MRADTVEFEHARERNFNYRLDEFIGIRGAPNFISTAIHQKEAVNLPAMKPQCSRTERFHGIAKRNAHRGLPLARSPRDVRAVNIQAKGAGRAILVNQFSHTRIHQLEFQRTQESVQGATHQPQIFDG